VTLFLGVLVLVLPVVLSVLNLYVPTPESNPKMNTRWKVVLIVVSFLYSALVGVWMLRTDAEAKLQQGDAVANMRTTVAAEDGKVITALNVTIGKLSDLVSSQQSQINDIHNSNIVTGNKPVKVEIQKDDRHAPAPAGEVPLDVKIASVPAPLNPAYGKNAIQFILTTNKVMDGGHVRIHCQNAFNQIGAMISGAGAMMGGGRGGKIDDDTYDTSINSPNWSPSSPLVITVYFDGDSLGTCTFKPLS
jgi:hypothetical protein